MAEQTLAPEQVGGTQGGSLTLSPAAGVVGATATVAAGGLPGDTEVTMHWASVRGNRISGQGFAGTTDMLGTAHTDAGEHLSGPWWYPTTEVGLT